MPDLAALCKRTIEAFGFFNGAPGHAYSIQREVYGRSFIVGLNYGF